MLSGNHREGEKTKNEKEEEEDNIILPK